MERTAELYLQILPGVECDCLYCRNTGEFIKTRLPPALAELTSRFGIDPRKVSEAVDYRRQADGMRLTELVYSFVGSMPNRPSPLFVDPLGRSQAARSYVEIGEGIQACACPGNSLGHLAFDREGACTLEVMLRVPWVLDEANPPD